MTATPQPSLSAFNRLRRGARAPAWVRDGIGLSWEVTTPSVALIAVSENATFRVAEAGAPTMVVRLARPGYAGTHAQLSSELTWIEALRETGIRTPRPVRGRDGALVQRLHDRQGAQWMAVAFDYVPGTILEERMEDAVAYFGEIGSLTARLHAQSRRWQPPVWFRRFSWDLDDLVGNAARWGHWTRAPLSSRQQEILQTAETSARETLARLGINRSPQHFGLIHADLRPSNVMIRGGQLTVIDFDDCGYGYYLYDFAAALTFYEHRPEAAQIAAAWMDGYRTAAVLHREDVRAACALSMLRRLTILGWTTTHRQDALPADLAAEYLPGTIDVAGRYLADSTWLVSS